VWHPSVRLFAVAGEALSLAFRALIAYARAVRSGCARVEGALHCTAGIEERLPLSPLPFRSRPAALEWTLAPAFGRAGSSAKKTGGHNRLAGKT